MNRRLTRVSSRLRRLHGVVQRLHAPRHKRRHRAAVEELVDELLRRAPNDFERSRLLQRAVHDGLATLWRSWRDEPGHLARPFHLDTKGGVVSLLEDISFAIRFHRRRPMYALVTVATLALAVGVNTAIYTVAQAALFRTLPYEDPDRIVEISGSTQGLVAMSPDFDWKPGRKLETAEGIEAAGLYIPGGGANLVGDSGASRLTLAVVSENFFDVMGVELTLGGGFPAAAGDAKVTVIAYSVWAQAFGSDPTVLGRTIYLSGLPYRIVGVAPPEVQFPGRTGVWVPQPLSWDFFSDAAGPTFIARLTPDADRARAEALLQARTEEDRAEVPFAVSPPRLVPLRGALTEGVRAPLAVLMGAAILVFLLGCLNLAGVAVSHFLRRSGELQVRVALGAGRPQVFRQLVAEALALGVVGALAGLGVSAAGVRLLIAWLPGDVPGLEAAGMGVASVLLAGALAVVAALCANAVPALRVIRNVHVSSAARSATEDRRQTRLRSVLAVAQVCIAMLLVVAAGLLGRSLIGLARTPMGIDVESVLLFETHLSHVPGGETENDEEYVARRQVERDQYLDLVQERLAGVPGVLGVGAVSQLPMAHDLGVGRKVRTQDIAEENAVSFSQLQATSGYFDAVGIRFIDGHTFSAPRESTEREAIISRQVAESMFGTAQAAGREILIVRGVGAGPNRGQEWRPATVVGVVDDVKIHGPDSEPQGQFYTSLYSVLDTQMGFAVRAAGDPRGIVDGVARTVQEVDPDVPPFEVHTTREALSRELSARQALALVSGLFAVTALALAAIGIYGLIAEGVARRRREMGIRIALGAPIRSLVVAVAGRGFLLAAAGIAIALPVALWGGRLLDDVLYNVSSRDPRVLVAAPALLLAIAALAAWLPARKAARVDPVEVLSAE